MTDYINHVPSWALISLANYKAKVKIKDYTLLSDSFICIHAEDDTRYFTSINNIILSDKESIIKERRTN